MALLLLFFAAVVGTLLLKKRGYFRLPPPLLVQLSFIQLVAAFSVYIGVTLLYVPFVRLLGVKFPSAWLNLIYLFTIAAFLVVYLYLLPRHIVRSLIARENLLVNKGGWRALMHGAGLWFLAYPYVLCANGWLKWLFPQDSGGQQAAVTVLKATKGHPLLMCATLLVVIVIAPFVEELLFRGFLQTWLRRHCSRFWTILLTASLFSGVHYAPGQNNIEIIGALFVLACFLSFIYEKEQHLGAPLALHALFNGVSAITALIAG